MGARSSCCYPPTDQQTYTVTAESGENEQMPETQATVESCTQTDVAAFREHDVPQHDIGATASEEANDLAVVLREEIRKMETQNRELENTVRSQAEQTRTCEDILRRVLAEQTALKEHINTQGSLLAEQTALKEHINTQGSLLAEQTALKEHINTQASLLAEQTALKEHINTQGSLLAEQVIQRISELLEHRLEQLVPPSASSVAQHPQECDDEEQTLPKQADQGEETVPKVPHPADTSPPPSPPAAAEATESNANADNAIFNYGTLQIGCNVTHTRDNSELIAKVDWDAVTDLVRANRQEQDRQRQLSEEERRQHSEQMAAMTQQHEDFTKFMFTLNEKLSDITTRLDQRQLNDVATRLYEHFNIRLLGVESGLACILDIPAAQWETVTQRQSEIQDILTSLLPESSQDEDIQWNLTPSPEDVDVRLSRPIQVTTEEHSQPGDEGQTSRTQTAAAAGVTFDPLTSRLEPGPSIELSAEGDRVAAVIISIVCRMGVAYMADWRNSAIKVCDLTAPYTLQHTVRLDGQPWGLAMVTGRQLLAVTILGKNRILLIDVTASPVVSSEVTTPRRYQGVASLEDGTLAVSCRKEGRLPARVDVITLEGRVVRTVTSSDEVSDLVRCGDLCLSVTRLYVSDCGRDCVHQADLVTGRLTTLPCHPNLRDPGQVCVDHAGNLYVACGTGCCVLVRTAAGEWRELLQGARHGEGGRERAGCVCVTDTGLLLVGWEGDLLGTAVKVYQLT